MAWPRPLGAACAFDVIVRSREPYISGAHGDQHSKDYRRELRGASEQRQPDHAEQKS
jgi:hypothetical protein